MLSLVIAYRPLFAPSLALRVMERLGGRSPVSPTKPSSRACLLPPNDLSGTKYSGVGEAGEHSVPLLLIR